MNRLLLIIYEPALFLLAALGWAGWELWSMREGKCGKAKAPEREPPAGPPPASPT
jgi:hypothetical protein